MLALGTAGPINNNTGGQSVNLDISIRGLVQYCMLTNDDIANSCMVRLQRDALLMHCCKGVTCMYLEQSRYLKLIAKRGSG